MPMVFVPLFGMSLERALRVMHAPKEASALALRANTEIPEQSVGMTSLLGAYMRSPLARFHAWFFSEEHEPAERWAETYDRAPLDALPPCVRSAVLYPNDLLLRPWGMRAVTRTLLALGWHPRHIAGLNPLEIRARFWLGRAMDGIRSRNARGFLRAHFFGALRDGMRRPRGLQLPIVQGAANVSGEGMRRQSGHFSERGAGAKKP